MPLPSDSESSLSLHEVLVVDIEELSKLPENDDDHNGGENSEHKPNNKEDQNKH